MKLTNTENLSQEIFVVFCLQIPVRLAPGSLSDTTGPQASRIQQEIVMHLKLRTLALVPVTHRDTGQLWH